jgi:predicted TIM-barrel fold metal-dependent hydrolase
MPRRYLAFCSDSSEEPSRLGHPRWATAIKTIEEAPFLSAEQKRDIFYNNAARFLRLNEGETARHHRM